MPEEEPVIFENWESDGCHVFVQGKHVLTLSTPESTSADQPTPSFLDDWISPEEFCDSLEKVLRAFGASDEVIADIDNEREHYRNRQVSPPTRTNADLLAAISLPE